MERLTEPKSQESGEAQRPRRTRRRGVLTPQTARAVTSPEVRHLLDLVSVLVLLIVVPAYIFCRLGLILLIAVPTAYIFCRLKSHAD